MSMLNPSFIISFKLAYRLLIQELKRGELSIMLAALVLAVSAVFSLSLFSERLQAALQDKSSEFLAADSILSSSRVMDNQWLEQAKTIGLATSNQVRFSSMLFAGDNMQLASIRAVDNAYPLKGELTLTDKAWSNGYATDLTVQPGHIWLDSKIMSNLQLAKGDLVELGDIKLIVSEIISSVPDTDMNIFNAGALALINLVDLDRTGVIQPGSRISYQLNLAGTTAQLTQYEDWLLPQLNRDVHRWVSLEDSESPVLRSVRRAEQYFLLASLLGIVLAATAIAVAAARFCERHFDLVAILKTLGTSRQQIKTIFASQLGLLAIVGIVIGLIIGYLGQYLIIHALREYLPDHIPTGGSRPWWLAISTGLLSLLLFSVYPLLKLFSIPPLRVLHRQMQGLANKDWLNWLFSAVAIFSLMWLYSGSLQLSSALLLSAGSVTLILLLIARSAIWGSRQAGANAGSAVKLALAGLYRRARENSVQLISFTVAIQLLLVVLVLRNDLLAQWQSQLPEGTPNYFAININQDELPKFKQEFAQQSIEITDSYPITRGRLTAINDQYVRDRVSKEKDGSLTGKNAEEAPRSIGRELNLTAYPTLPDENKLVAGQWWSADDTKYQVSIEEQLAERMAIHLNDKLTFNVGGSEFSVVVTSIRSVKWESMKPNFFMIFNPIVLQDYPASYIASFYVPSDIQSKLNQLMIQFPSATLIDIDAIIGQIRDITQQVSLAIEFILVLVIVAGGLVLIAQVQASMDERRQELVILRTLGAKSSLLRNSVTLEFIILGAFAGLFAAFANEIALYILQTEVFKMPASFHWHFWLIGPATGALVVGSLGLMSCWKLMQVKTQALLRALS